MHNIKLDYSTSLANLIQCIESLIALQLTNTNIEYATAPNDSTYLNTHKV